MQIPHHQEDQFNHKPPKNRSKYLNSLNNNGSYDSKQANISDHYIKQNESTADKHIDNLEMMEDPLIRKKKVNEVIDIIKLNLIDDEDFKSIESDSRQNSASNTIDEAYKHVLKEQVKKELQKNQYRTNENDKDQSNRRYPGFELLKQKQMQNR